MIPIKDSIGRVGNLLFKQAYLYAQFFDGKIPDIYLQDESYFAHHADKIRELFGQGIIKLPYVAIHVRRGDYVNNPFYVDLFADGYYERAMELFPKGTLFRVFSDDIGWCKEQKIFENCTFSEKLNEIKDLNAMASCVGHIIANSSFSWWGAWLSTHGGKVIAPKRWYSDNVERTILPNNWTRV